jgi:DUF1680 family protein
MADVARLTQDESLFKACERLWEDITKKKMYITGGIGGTHLGEAFSFAYDLQNDTAYAETCASIGLVFFARRMLEIRPDAKYANVMERTLYNGILSGMALDGKSFFYVNPLEVNPIASYKDERKRHVKPVRQKWFGCACCPPNLARLISSISSYAFTETEDTLFVHLYIGSTLTKKVKNKKVSIGIQSDLPWDGRVKVVVRAQGTGFILALRLPDWSERYQLVDKEDLEVTEQDGYLYIKKEWEEEDIITILFPMEARLMVSRTEVRENVGKAALVRGPMVYCLEEADNGKHLHLLSVKAKEEFTLAEETIQDITVRTIRAKGERITVKEQGDEIYYKLKPEEKTEVDLTYVPYYIWANRGENEMQVWTTVVRQLGIDEGKE